MIKELQTRYLRSRVERVDEDFLKFEEQMTAPEDLELMLHLCRNTELCQIQNPHNSIMLYVLGLTNDFDFKKGRSNTIGGSPPDVDLDFSSRDLSKLVKWMKDYWGTERVVNIGTYGVMKPRSFTDKFFRATAPKPPDFTGITDQQEQDKLAREYERTLYQHQQKGRTIRACIPEDQFGKSPTIHETIYGNDAKGYEAHPELLKPEYQEWREAALKFEGIVSSAGVHPAGIIVSDDPVVDHIPLMYSEEPESGEWRAVTQYTKDEVEELGLLKYDLLRTDNLAILKLAFELIKKHQEQDVTFESIPDDDQVSYELLRKGYLQGVFQMEASEAPREIIELFQPNNLFELSDCSAINRPGPKSLGLHLMYAGNKSRGSPPKDMHPAEADILKTTYWTMIYQEQAMEICSKLAGFDLKEADDIRRSMGKKDEKKMAKIKPAFLEGCARVGAIDAKYALVLWDKLIKYADYAFNSAHSVSYSQLTYICMYLKAHYPLEFYTALFSVRGEAQTSKDWGRKGTAYLSEMRRYFRQERQQDVHVLGPSINHSLGEYQISNHSKRQIRIGLSSIRGVGAGAVETILLARGNTPFKDIQDFLARVNKNKVNRKTFGCLVAAGVFDCLGYTRQDLREATDALYDYQQQVNQYAYKLEKLETVLEANRQSEELNRRRDLLVTKRKLKLGLDSHEQQFLLENKKKPMRKIPEVPPKPEPTELSRTSTVSLNIKDLLDEVNATGLLIRGNPANLVYKGLQEISDLEEDEQVVIAGFVIDHKVIKDRSGKEMLLGVITDGEATIRFLVFASRFRGWEEERRLVRLKGKLSINERGTSFIADFYEQHT